MVFIRLARVFFDCGNMRMRAYIVRAHARGIGEPPILYHCCRTSHGVTRQGKRSERIHPFLAKVHRFLYAHVDFLTLRTFKQAANFEVALCPNYLINYLIILLVITATSSSLHHHYHIKVRFSDWDSVSN